MKAVKSVIISAYFVISRLCSVSKEASRLRTGKSWKLGGISGVETGGSDGSMNGGPELLGAPRVRGKKFYLHHF